MRGRAFATAIEAIYSDAELAPSEVRYLLLHLHRSDEAGALSWSTGTIAARLALNQTVVERARSRLVSLGWLRVAVPSRGRVPAVMAFCTRTSAGVAETSYPHQRGGNTRTSAGKTRTATRGLNPRVHAGTDNGAAAPEAAPPEPSRAGAHAAGLIEGSDRGEDTPPRNGSAEETSTEGGRQEERPAWGVKLQSFERVVKEYGGPVLYDLVWPWVVNFWLSWTDDKAIFTQCLLTAHKSDVWNWLDALRENVGSAWLTRKWALQQLHRIVIAGRLAREKEAGTHDG